jgi:hypothetical protein
MLYNDKQGMDRMTGVARFDCFPSDFLNGIIGLNGDEIAAYTIVMMLQYDRGAAVAYVGRERELCIRAGLPKAKLMRAVENLVKIGKLALGEDGSLSEIWLSARFKQRLLRQKLPEAVRSLVVERDGFICSYCGADEGPFEIDHIRAVVHGGDDALDNLCIACMPCNRSKGAKSLEAWLQ